MPYTPKVWNTGDTILAADLNHAEQGVATAQTTADAKLDTTAAPELIRDTIGTALVAGTNVTITVNDPADTITIASSTGSAVLTVAATVTAAGALVTGKHNPVDATSGALTMTLPTGAASGTLISAEKFDASANAVTLSGNIRGVGSSTISLVWQREDLLLVADSAGSWWPVAGHKTKASLDAAYDAAGAASAAQAFAIQRANHTGTQATSTITGFDEAAQDAAAALFTGGTHTGISFSYNDAGNVINATASAAAGITVQDENGTLATGVTQIDFQGAGITATAGTGEIVVTVPGGGSLTAAQKRAIIWPDVATTVLARTLDPIYASGGRAISSQFMMFLGGVQLYAGETYSNLSAATSVTQAAAGLTEARAYLMDSSGVVLARSNDAVAGGLLPSGAWAISTAVTFPFATAYTAGSDQFACLGILAAGTTMPNLISVTALNAALLTMGARKPEAWGGNGVTSYPAGSFPAVGATVSLPTTKLAPIYAHLT